MFFLVIWHLGFSLNALLFSERPSVVPQACSFTSPGSFLHSIYYDLVYVCLFIVWLATGMAVSWRRDPAVLSITVLPVLRTLLGRASTQWIFADGVNESRKSWGCKAFVSPLLSITAPVPKSQTTGFIAFHLCLCQALARTPTRSLRVYQWRHSLQCQEAANDPGMSVVASSAGPLAAAFHGTLQNLGEVWHVTTVSLLISF